MVQFDLCSSVHLQNLSHWLLACLSALDRGSLGHFEPFSAFFPMLLAGAQLAATPGKTLKTLVTA